MLGSGFDTLAMGFVNKLQVMVCYDLGGGGCDGFGIRDSEFWIMGDQVFVKLR